jgi:hypothetical protein
MDKPDLFLINFKIKNFFFAHLGEIKCTMHCVSAPASAPIRCNDFFRFMRFRQGRQEMLAISVISTTEGSGASGRHLFDEPQASSAMRAAFPTVIRQTQK